MTDPSSLDDKARDEPLCYLATERAYRLNHPSPAAAAYFGRT
ncbi:hypothetical protein RI103_22460 [Paraburkholderia sp. FT54]|nr:hypothetical protein [Paraburkholderia sp. FT54]WNC93558.1 hypothetical protein RI103_22460 [Paraburkholderia sp. FT54]